MLKKMNPSYYNYYYVYKIMILIKLREYISIKIILSSFIGNNLGKHL